VGNFLKGGFVMNKQKKFPIFSFLGMAYALIAGMSLFSLSNNIVLALGYGITNLAYVLIAASIFTGKFRIFRLHKRLYTFGSAVFLFILGLILSNIV
jgi:high-affinity Fe2+/Pb2+ permease